MIIRDSEEDIRNKHVQSVSKHGKVHVSGTPDSAYYYSTYNAEGQAQYPQTSKDRLDLRWRSKPYRTEFIEFDYCCVHASQREEENGIRDDHRKL